MAHLRRTSLEALGQSESTVWISDLSHHFLSLFSTRSRALNLLSCFDFFYIFDTIFLSRPSCGMATSMYVAISDDIYDVKAVTQSRRGNQAAISSRPGPRYLLPGLRSLY